MPAAITAATSPIAIAHPNSATVGVPTLGRSGMVSEKLPSPVQLSSPTKMSDPMPAATRPGTSTSPIVGPARPEASMSRNAPSSGDPSRVLMALKLPAAAMTVAVCGGASRAARRTARAPSPPPRAMSGASGPITTPRLRPASAARKTPGSSTAVGGARPASNPSAGDSPPCPGRYRMVRPTNTPARASNGSGHHAGAPSKPRSFGRSVKTQSWSSSSSHRKPYAAAAIGAPTAAASTSSFR